MANDDASQPAEGQRGGEAESTEEKEPREDLSSSSDEESEPEYDSDSENGGAYDGYSSTDAEDDQSPETVIRRFTEALDSRKRKKQEEADDRNRVYHEDLFDFPKDPERWREEDLRELWADGPLEATNPGWDPVWADEEDWEIVKEEVKAGRDPPIAPFYLPYRRYYPAIPDNHHDISNPKSVIEELDRIEEFLKWVSFIFPDGSTYEGTVWDDLAHGKGVYVAEQGLVRYEGEWLRNEMEGHGVVEVEIPGVEPAPGSSLEAKMRAEGRIISRDFMSPEDKKWLEMDIEDSFLLAGNLRETPFYEKDEWISVFGEKPEKGRYRYAGQWKHGRMHGCGVYEVNERIIYGRFYFGEHLEDSTGCDSDVSALHAGIAEVAAAKSRMFINKPDGMVREQRGPYGDPQHPYFYEEEDVWMAPGFINQFYEVSDYWKTYVQEVDQEREMWLNSFYKSPLRIPMPAELEHWWSKDDGPEFVLINKEPEPDPEDPSNLIYTEDPVIVHTPTGRLINYVDDEEYGVRLFWQPELKDGEDVDPDKAEFLPLGFDEFYGRAAPTEKKESRLMWLLTSAENAIKPVFDRLDSWVEEKKKASEINQQLIEKELELVEAEICLDEALEDIENELKRKQKEEEKKAAAGKDGDEPPAEASEDEEESEEEDEEGDEGAPTSFGTVRQGETNNGNNKFGKSPFSSLSISVASFGLASMVPPKLQESFLSWKNGRRQPLTPDLSFHPHTESLADNQGRINSVKIPRSSGRGTNLRAVLQQRRGLPRRKKACCNSQLSSLARTLSSQRSSKSSKTFQERSDCGDSRDNFSVLSFHVPVNGTFMQS